MSGLPACESCWAESVGQDHERDMWLCEACFITLSDGLPSGEQAATIDKRG